MSIKIFPLNCPRLFGNIITSLKGKLDELKLDYHVYNLCCHNYVTLTRFVISKVTQVVNLYFEKTYSLGYINIIDNFLFSYLFLNYLYLPSRKNNYLKTYTLLSLCTRTFLFRYHKFTEK